MPYNTRLFDLLRLLMFVAGSLLFGVSLLFEVFVFTSIAGGALLGISLATGLELTKVVTILAEPISDSTSRLGKFLRSTALISLRIGLIGVSALCSGAFLALHIDQPNIHAVRESDQLKTKQEHEIELVDRLRQIEKRRDAEIADLEELRARERARLKERHEPEIRKLEALLTQEMDNDVDGDFIGPRYRELRTRSDQHERAYSDALDKLEAKVTSSIAASRQASSEKTALARKLTDESLKTSIAAIREDNYESDQRVSLPIVYAAKRAIQQISGASTNDLRIGIVFAVLLSVVIEVGIFCIFSQYASVISRVLVAQSEIWKSRQLAIETAVRNIDDFQQHNENEQKDVRLSRRNIERRMRRRFDDAIKTGTLS